MISPTIIPVISYPIVWEFVGGLLVLWSGLTLLSYTFSPTRLSERTALRFLEFNRSIVATGREDDLRGLGEEIRGSLEIMAKQCGSWIQSEHLSKVAEMRDKSTQTVQPNEFTKVCYSLLDTWSDPQFCNALVRWCPGTVVDIFQLFGENNALDAAYAMATELVHQAIADHRSIAHREGGFSGLGRSKLFMRAIFGDIRVLRSEVRPLNGWHIYRDKDITQEKIRSWGVAISMALETCIKEHDLGGLSASGIRQGLDTLNCACVSVLADRERSGSDKDIGLLYDIGQVFAKTISQLANSNTGIHETGTVSIDRILMDNSLHDGIAKELFDFLGHITSLDEWSQIHTATIGIMMTLFSRHDEPTSADIKAVQIRIANQFMEQLKDNLDPTSCLYPSAVKFLLVYFGINEPNRALMDEVEYGLAVYFHKELKAKFAALWKANEKFASDMLPSDVEYDPARQVLSHKRFRREAKSVELQLDRS